MTIYYDTHCSFRYAHLFTKKSLRNYFRQILSQIVLMSTPLVFLPLIEHRLTNAIGLNKWICRPLYTTSSFVSELVAQLSKKNLLQQNKKN